MPKVALLFLTSGELFHEPSWRQWFASAEGLVPALYARETACEQQDPRYWEAVQSYCSIKGRVFDDRKMLEIITAIAINTKITIRTNVISSSAFMFGILTTPLICVSNSHRLI